MKTYFFSPDEMQLWLMVEPPIPIDAQVHSVQRRYDEAGSPYPRWGVTIESWFPESIKILRDFRSGCRLAIAHCPISALRKNFGASSVVAWMNDCQPMDAEIREMVQIGDVHAMVTYSLVITCNVALLPEAAE